MIALTNVASRHAGYAGAGWLFLFGLIGKFGGLVLSIPQCVLGGATSFLFACVLVAGIKVGAAAVFASGFVIRLKTTNGTGVAAGSILNVGWLVAGRYCLMAFAGLMLAHCLCTHVWWAGVEHPAVHAGRRDQLPGCMRAGGWSQHGLLLLLLGLAHRF